MSIDQITSQIVPILKKHGVIRASLFGSAVRGEMKRGSDVDVLVEIPKEFDLLDFIKIKLNLEKKLRRKVDLVEYDSIKPSLRSYIMNEQISIFSA